MSARFATAVLVSVLACGPEVVHRPLELFIGGLSGRAETLVVLVFPGPDGAPPCTTVTLGTVQSLEAPLRAEWRRETADMRGLALPEVDTDVITLIAYSEDAERRPIQLACERIEYADIESPDLSIQLSRRQE